MESTNRNRVLGTLAGLLLGAGSSCSDPARPSTADDAAVTPNARQPSSRRQVLFSAAGGGGGGTPAAETTRLDALRDPDSLERAEQIELLPTPRRNEQHVSSKLERIAEVQRQLRESGMLDVDGDEVGEPMFLSELAGRRVSRIGTENATALRETFEFDKLFGEGLRDGIALTDGYCFRIFIPDSAGEWHAEPDPRRPLPSAFNGAASGVQWRCYAWPRIRSTTGHLAFYVDESGLVRASRNEHPTYDGRDNGPGVDAATGLKLDMLLHPSDAYRGGDGGWWREYEVPAALRPAPPK